MTLAPGQLLGRYEILGSIGAGGMGEVWRAKDTELDREVAVKVLPESFAEDESRLEGFHREAKALAALTHPNLLEIYDVGSTDGIHYAVTELLEGDTLRKRITPSGLPWKKVTEIGAAVADGLAAAHGRGIVHRDLKPENLFVTADGRVKILDFGLASLHEKSAPEAETATLTEAGTVMGTPGYMAPEQVKGEQADARSDIFSLGCVLYEMASGHRAFGGDTGVEVIAAILKEEPPQLSSSGAAVPVDLERAVHRCLEKRPEARFQSAADLAYSLKSLGSSTGAQAMATPAPSAASKVGEGKSPRWRTPIVVAGLLLAVVTSWWALTQRGGEQAAVEATLDPNRIAVVPFANRTGDASLDNLAALTADRITQGLAELDEVEVAPASVVAATSAGVDPSQLAREVASGTRSGMVLTGVWDAVGTGLELQATLEDATLGSVVRAFDPIAATVDAPEEAVATLRGWTLMAVQDHLHPILAWAAGDRFPDYEAYVAYRSFFEVFEGDKAMEAAQYLFKTVELDPEFARPRIMAGAMWAPGAVPYLHDAALSFYQPVHEMELTPIQRRHVEMIDARIEGRWKDAYRLARDELDRDPNNSWQKICVLRNAGHYNQPNVVLDLFKSLDPDPLTPAVHIYSLTGHALKALHVTGRHEEELALARDFLARGPVQTTGASVRGYELRALAALGRTDEIDPILTEVFLEPDFMTNDSLEMRMVVYELRAHGFREEAQALAERAVAWSESDRGLSPGMRLRCGPCDAESLMAAGRYEEAGSILETLLAEEPEGAGWIEAFGVCAAHIGDRATALEMDARLAALGEDIGPTGVPYGNRGWKEFLRAGIAAQLGERDRAIHLIQQAVAAGYSEYRLIHVNPAFEPLWDDPEFQEILRPKG